MKIRNFKKFVPFALFLFAAATFSSCNKGLGCPNNFSIDNVVEVIVDQALDVIKD